MNHRVAVFVYRRLLLLPTTPLRLDQLDYYWTLNEHDATLALGVKAKIDQLLSRVEALLESEEAKARALRDEAVILEKTFQELIPKLDYAIASRRLHKRCDPVLCGKSTRLLDPPLPRSTPARSRPPRRQQSFP
jgi:hypothetical protein